MDKTPRNETNRLKTSENFKRLNELVRIHRIIQLGSKLIFWIFFLGLLYLFSNPISSYILNELFFIGILTGSLVGLSLNHDYAMKGVMNKLVTVTTELYDGIKESRPLETEIPSNWIEPILTLLNRLGHINDSYRITKYFRPLTGLILAIAAVYPLYFSIIFFYIPPVFLAIAWILAFLGCFAFYSMLNSIPEKFLIQQVEPENSDFTVTLFGLVAALYLFKPQYWSFEDFKPTKINKGVSLLCNSLGIRIRDIIAYGTGIIESIEIGTSIATLHLAVLSESNPETLDPVIIIDDLRKRIKALDPIGTLNQLSRIEEEYVNILNVIESLEITFFSTKTTWYTMAFPEKVKMLALILGILVTISTIISLLGRLLGL